MFAGLDLATAAKSSVGEKPRAGADLRVAPETHISLPHADAAVEQVVASGVSYKLTPSCTTG